MAKSNSRAPVKPSKDKIVFKKTSVNKKEINTSPPMYRGGIRL